VKWDCWQMHQMASIRRVFPGTASIVLYRDPVEVLVSQMHNPGRWTVEDAPGAEGREVHVARLLAGICRAALEQDVMLVNYSELPGVVCDGLFGRRWSPHEIAQMKAAALRALEIDPSLGEPHAALGAYKANYEHDTAAGEQEYRRAIELSPNYATAYHWFGENLSQLGRFDDALPIWRKAVETDPFSLAIGTDYALEYLFYYRKYDEAADYLKKLIETDPNYVRAHYYLSEVYIGMGRYEDSISEREKAALLDGANPDQISRSKGEVLTAFKAGGPKGYWSKVLELQQNNIQKGIKIGSVVLAETYLHLGKKDEAFELLGRAVEEQNSALDWLKVDPRWDAIRTDPRFGELLRRMKLPE